MHNIRSFDLSGAFQDTPAFTGPHLQAFKNELEVYKALSNTLAIQKHHNSKHLCADIRIETTRFSIKQALKKQYRQHAIKNRDDSHSHSHSCCPSWWYIGHKAYSVHQMHQPQT